MQQSYASDFDLSIRSEVRVINKFYDHLKPFAPIPAPINTGCVMTYLVNNFQEYLEQVPVALVQFLKALQIEKLYILDFLNTALSVFPFENFRKRNCLKRLLGGKLNYTGLLSDTTIVAEILHLFLFSGLHGRPVIFFITAKGVVPLSVRLCDDGNFHLQFQVQFSNQVLEAAHKTGFTIGDVDLCWEHSIYKLRRK